MEPDNDLMPKSIELSDEPVAAAPLEHYGRIFEFLIRCRSITVIFWLVLASLLIFPAVQYSHKTNISAVPPPGSLTFDSAKIIDEVYPWIAKQDPFAIFVDIAQLPSSLGPLCMATPRTPLEMQARLEVFSDAVKDYMINTYGEYISSFLSPTDLLRDEFRIPASALCSRNKTAAMLVIMFSKGQGYNGRLLLRNVTEVITRLFNQTFQPHLYEDKVALHFIGNPVLQNAITDGLEDDIMHLDMISIPMGFVVVTIFLRSFWMTLVALTNLGISFVISFGISSLLTPVLGIPSIAQSIQSAILVALTFDYTLFFFNRLPKDIKDGLSPKQALHNAYHTAGHVIFISGFSLCIVFVLMCILNVELVTGLAMACAISIVVLMFVCITMCVALVSLFPSIFVGLPYDFITGDYLNCRGCCQNRVMRCWLNCTFHKLLCRKRKHSAPAAASEQASDVSISGREAPANKSRSSEDVPLLQNNAEQPTAESKLVAKRTPQAKDSRMRKCLEKLDDYLENKPPFLLTITTKSRCTALCALLLVLAAGGVFAYPALKATFSVDLLLTLPRGAESVESMKRFGELFLSGLASPTYIILNKTIPGVANTLVNEKDFLLIYNFSEYMRDEAHVRFNGTHNEFLLESFSSIMSPVDLFGLYVPSAIAQNLARDTTWIARMYQIVLNRTVPDMRNISVMAISVAAGVPVTCTGADVFVPFVRSCVDKYRQQFSDAGITVSIYGWNDVMMDMYYMLMRRFPYVIAATICTFFLLMSLIYQSIVVPIRLIIESGVILSIVFGTWYICFNLLGLGGSHLIFWIAPVMCFCVGVGLNTDYDVFVYSYMDLQYKQALQQGNVHITRDMVRGFILRSGQNLRVVFAAGVIMAVSFIGLCLSSLGVNVAIGCALLLSVLLNTFVVVPIIVPSLLMLFGELSFWPGIAIARRRLKKKNSAAGAVIDGALESP